MGSSKNSGTIGKRLREERLRLGYNVRSFAEVGGVGHSSQSRYENDLSVPDSDYLNRISEAGAEVFWIMRGMREDDEARDKRAAMYTPEISLLIKYYEGSSADDQSAIRRLAQTCYTARKSALEKHFGRKTRAQNQREEKP